MVRWDPFRIVNRRGRLTRARSSVGGLAGEFLLRGRPLGELGALSTLALLRDVRGDPDSIEEIDDTGEARGKEEVQKQAVYTRAG